MYKMGEAANPLRKPSQRHSTLQRQFTEVFILDKVQRQDAAGAEDIRQRVFIDLLLRARDAQLTEDDWNILLERDPSRQTVETKADFEDATRLFYSKSEVNDYNGEKVRALGTPVVKCTATLNCATARRAPADTASGLKTVLFLGKGAKVMLTKNLWQEAGLVNGIRGEVVEIVYTEGAPAPLPPCYVVVRFDGYTGPDRSSGERYRGCVHISPVQSAWSSGGANGEGNTVTRTQLPLKLCWALTMHKSQGQTLDKAVIDLGKREACTGLTFFCLSLAKRIDDVLVTAMPFDRIGRLGQSPVLQARRVEEVRLRRLAVQTRQRLG